MLWTFTNKWVNNLGRREGHSHVWQKLHRAKTLHVGLEVGTICPKKRLRSSDAVNRTFLFLRAHSHHRYRTELNRTETSCRFSSIPSSLVQFGSITRCKRILRNIRTITVPRALNYKEMAAQDCSSLRENIYFATQYSFVVCDFA